MYANVDKDQRLYFSLYFFETYRYRYSNTYKYILICMCSSTVAEVSHIEAARELFFFFLFPPRTRGELLLSEHFFFFFRLEEMIYYSPDNLWMLPCSFR